MQSITRNLTIHNSILNTIKEQSFNIFKVSKALTRDTTFSLVGWKIMDDLGLVEICNEEKFACFLDKIYLTYSRDVAYHNDLHGADVGQMVFRMLTSGNLANILNLNKLDLMSFVVAALCHDVGHDSFNNSYHINACTKRAIDFNDVSV